MRAYEPIWLQLKQDYKASLIANTSRHATIIQAVRKEKWRDLGFKLEQAELGKRWKIIAISNSKTGILDFTLEPDTRININSL